MIQVTFTGNTSQTKETLQHVHKGTHLLVTGSLTVRTYQKQDGSCSSVLGMSS